MLPDHYEVRFNQHHGKDGKFSSKNGTGGGYTPGAWKAEHVDREAKVKAMQADLEKNMSGWLRKRAEEADGPNWSRKAAEELVGFDATGTVYHNGRHTVAFETKNVTPAQQKQFLKEVDNLQTKAPVSQLNLRVQDKSKFSWDTGGETYLGQGEIRLNERIFTDYDNNMQRWAQDFPSTSMPMAQHTKASTYVLHHEWGHAVDTTNSGSNTVVFRQARTAGGLGAYGKQATDDGRHTEAFAESFAEWSLTGGKTTNPAAQVYANHYEWGEKWPSLLTTSSGA